MVLSRKHDEMLDKVTRVRRAWRDERGTLATVRRFNAKLSAKSPWLVILCDSCGAVTDFDLRVKPRNGGFIFCHLPFLTSCSSRTENCQQ